MRLWCHSVPLVSDPAAPQMPQSGKTHMKAIKAMKALQAAWMRDAAWACHRQLGRFDRNVRGGDCDVSHHVQYSSIAAA